MKPPVGSATGDLFPPSEPDFDERTTSEEVPLSKRPPGELRFSLVVCSSEGVQLSPLTAERPIIIGREPGSSVVVSDRGVSRHHARFVLAGEEVWVEDLDSRNGTHVNGTPVPRAKVTPRDEVTLGPVSVTLRRTPWLEDASIGLSSHDLFQSLLQREVGRSFASGKRVSLLMIATASESEARFVQWCRAVAPDLGGSHLIGLYGPNTVEVLVPDSDQDAALALATKLLDRAAPLGIELHCGVACYPDSAGSAEELIEVSRSALHRAERGGGIAIASPSEPSRPATDDVPVVRASGMLEVLETIGQFKNSKVPVLIQGETGTGKEVIARALHEMSNRSSAPFRSINCGAIPAQLAESLLFGHRRGSFTGADRDQKGLFEEAHEGVLLLDEIGDLPLASQAVLLRVLETRRIMPVGTSSEIDVDVRILAATHRNLDEMCDAGMFRRDLLFRLNAVTVKLPPLRERRDEIAPLAEHFVGRANRDNGCHVRKISSEALELMMAYDWPGNVRELRNVVERAVVLAGGGVITAGELPDRLRNRERKRPIKPVVEVTEELEDVPTLPPEPLDLKTQLQHFEASIIQDALARSGGNQSRAAELLDMPRRTLVHKLKTYGIDRRPQSRQPTVMLGPEGLPYDFATQVERYEHGIIQKTMERCGGDRARAARLLGIAKKVLAKKLGEST